jgi:hypothetical protein
MNEEEADELTEAASAIAQPIPISDECQTVLVIANQGIEIARLKKDHAILYTRLKLGVPNDFAYDEFSMSFQPPRPVMPPDKD